MEPHEIVFLLDVDNTLIDNDRIQKDLRTYLRRNFGKECEQGYWTILEQLRSELGYVDHLGTLQRYRLGHPRAAQILGISSYLIDYHFANRLYPGSLDAIAHLWRWGPTAILSDGDAVFQPRKIERSGLQDAVGGNVLVYVHKEQMLDDVESKYPAKHYVMVDDKLRILTAMKQTLGSRLTTVFVKQGHYATDVAAIAQFPPADIELDRIGDLVQCDLKMLMGTAARREAA